MQRRPPRGSYLLEVSALTFATAFFLVGASDLARIFHARSAVRAGVREGLRCLYPTDAGCTPADSLNPAPASQRYNVSVWDESIQYIMPTEIWKAQAQWVTEPEVSVPNEETRVSQATVQLARNRFQESDVLFPVQGHHPYLVQQRHFPLIGGADPLNPEFRDRTTHARVSPHKTLDISGIRGSTRVVAGPLQSGFEPQFRIGSAQFSVRDAWPARSTELPHIRALEEQHGIKVNCYDGELVNSASSARIDWSQHTSLPPLCRYRGDTRLFSNDGLRVPVMLRITGAIRGTSLLGQGKVLVQLRWEGSNDRGEQRLGGRLISAGASGNFVTRGAVLDDIALNARAPYEKGGTYYEELRDNGTIMLVPPAAQLYLDVFLISTNGQPVAWQGGALELFYPSFSFYPERYSCELSSNPAVCAGPVPVRPLYASLELERFLESRATFAKECSRKEPAGYEPDPAAFLAALRERLRAGEEARATTFWEAGPPAGSGCAPTSKTVACSGTVHEHLKGCSECEQVDERKLPAGCDEPTFDPARDKVTGLSCSTEDLSTVERRMGCSGEPLPACAKQHVTRGDHSLWQGDSAACELAVRHAPAPFESSPIPVSKCGAAPPLVDQYRSDHKVPQGVEIELSKVPGPDTGSPEAPQDPCVDYDQKLIRSPERSCGSLLSSEGATQCCAENAGRCIMRSVLLPQPGSGSGSSGVEVAAALQRAASTVLAAYPQAVRSDACDGTGGHCLAVSAQEIPGKERASMRASLSVPLRLSGIFGREALTVEHQESRRLERTMLAE